MKSSNQFTNFSRILKNLQMENVSLPELKLLKQQHAYLEKLRQQRSKIQQIKQKYDKSQENLVMTIEQNRNLKNLIQQQNRTIIMLENQISETANRTTNFQHNLSKQLEIQKEKYKNKNQQLLNQIDQLRKQLKSKDILLFTLEEESQQKIKDLKEGFNQEKRRIAYEYETKVKRISETQSEQETVELQRLIQRQNKALKMQTDQYQEALQKLSSLESQYEQLQQQCGKMNNEQNLLANRVEESQKQNEELRYRLSQYEQDSLTRQQLEEIRKKMSQLTKGQIERIQLIVNDS